MQSKFQVQVERYSSGSWALHHDSGQVASSNSYYDIPSSARLSANTQYRFRVMVWDSKDAASPWSDYFTWTTNKPYYPSGTWTSDPIYVGREGRILNGTVTWNAATPPGTSIACDYRTSSDGQNWSAWNPITNGGSIPPVNYIQLRFTLTTTDEFQTPELQDVTIFYPAEYVSSGTWESLPITNLQNQSGNLILTWNESKPNGTNIIVETSTDGGNTWTPVSNGANIPPTGDLRVRVTLTSSTPASTPFISNMAIKAGTLDSKPPFRISSKTEVTFPFENSLVGWSPQGPVYASFSRPSVAYKADGTKVSPSSNMGVTALGLHQDDIFVTVVGGEVRTVTPDGQVSVPKYSGLSRKSRWSFCHFEGGFLLPNLLMTDGSKTLRFTGTALYELTTVPAGLNYITTHANRVYGAVGQTLHFSALRKADDWQTANDAGSIAVETPDGGPITAIHAGLDRLVVFKRSSIHDLYGTNPSNFRLVLVSNQVGCVSHNSAVTLNGVLRWLGADGIYEYSGGFTPSKEFSLPVQAYVDRITKGYENRACAATDGKRYYLALPIDGHQDPNIILEYDPQFQVWTVWHTTARVLCMTSRKNQIYAGLEDGRIVRFDPDVTTDDGEAVPWVWESPPIGSGSYITRKRWYDMWLVVDLPTGSTMDVYLSDKPEGEDSWTLVKSLTASTDMQSVRIILPIRAIANANWVRVRLVGTGPCRVHELAYRDRILPL